MKTAEEYLLEKLSGFEDHQDYKDDNIKAMSDFMRSYADYFHQQKLKDMMPSNEEIGNAFNDAYIKAGDNTYFGNGFKRGVEFLKNKLLND